MLVGAGLANGYYLFKQARSFMQEYSVQVIDVCVDCITEQLSVLTVDNNGSNNVNNTQLLSTACWALNQMTSFLRSISTVTGVRVCVERGEREREREIEREREQVGYTHEYRGVYVYGC